MLQKVTIKSKEIYQAIISTTINILLINPHTEVNCELVYSYHIVTDNRKFSSVKFKNTDH